MSDSSRRIPCSVPASRNVVPLLIRVVVAGFTTFGFGYLAAAVTVAITLWRIVDSNVSRFAAEGHLNPTLTEFLRQMGHALAIGVSGAFLTLRPSIWRRNLVIAFLCLGMVPLGIFAVSLGRGIGTDGHPLVMREIDPGASAWFDGPTGRPLLWHGRDDAGKVRFFNRPGFHPETKDTLEAVTGEFRRQWKEEHDRAAAKEAERHARERTEAEALEADRREAASLTATAEREAEALRKAAAAEAEATRRRAAEEAETIRRRAAEEDASIKSRKEAVAPMPRSSTMLGDRVGLRDESVVAKPIPSPAAREMPPASADVRSVTIPLRWNADLRCNLGGAATLVRSNGPAWVKVDDGPWRGIPNEGFSIRAGGSTLFVRPHRTDATAVTLTPLMGTP